jgi:PKD repeat protein
MKYFLNLVIFLFISYSIFAQSGWTEQNSGSTQILRAVKFFDNMNGIAAGEDAFLKTTDGGSNWTTANSDELLKGIKSFTFISSSTGWAIANDGIIKTSNSGTSWVLQEPSSSGATKKIFFYNNNNGWACGPSGVIIGTTNSGEDWSVQTTNITKNINSIHFINANLGWAVGNASTILTTTNAGANWTAQTAEGVSSDFSDVKFINQNTGWITGDNGKIIKTTDGGENWVLQDSKTSDDFYFVYFIDENRGWAGGELGTIVGTSNGGVTWALQGSSVVWALYDLFFVTERIGWAVGNNGTIVKSFSSGEFIQANFTADTLIGIKPFTVTFTDKSTGNPTAYSWNFGDGNGSTQKNPTHTYTTPGIFPVILSITSGTYTGIKQRENYIHVDDILTAKFSATPTEGSATLTVQFTDETFSPPETWLWDFGDGSSSTFQNPSHIYEYPGKYSVQLRVSNYQGQDSLLKTNYITVNEQLFAEFYGAPRSGPAPLKVNFYDDSQGKPNSWLWNFGDGATSTQREPSYTYQSSGTYTVSLRASDGIHTNTQEKIAYIRVTDALKANFTASPLTGELPLNVTFLDQSFGGATQWVWNFGDGNTSKLQNPTHKYILPGIYTVRLTIIDDNQNTDAMEKVNYITITGTPVLKADFTATPRNGTEPLTVQFTDLTDGEVVSRNWNFGDGGSSTETNPRYTYQKSGYYSVTLVVYNGATRDTMKKENYITINPDQSGNVTANFSADITEGDRPLIVQFTDLSIGEPTGFEWEFGDSGYSFDKEPSHTYGNSGTFTVSLTVRKADKSHKATKENYIWVKEPINVNDYLKYDLFNVLAFPNPFRDYSKIKFELQNSANVVLEIFDLLGNKVDEPLNQRLDAGIHHILFSPYDIQDKSINSGVFYYKLRIMENNNYQVRTGEIIFIK